MTCSSGQPPQQGTASSTYQRSPVPPGTSAQNDPVWNTDMTSRVAARIEPLSGPVPIITAISTPHFHAIGPGQTVAGTPYTGPAPGARPSSGPRHGKVRRGGRIDLKPGTRGPAGGSGASPVGPLGTLRQTATPSRKVSIRRLRARRVTLHQSRPAITSGQANQPSAGRTSRLTFADDSLVRV